MAAAHKPCLLTGDTPTGRLHLGHWVGSLENRVRLQNEGRYDCYFLLANTHAFTTRLKQPQAIRESVLDIMCDYLAAGIDPEKSTVFTEMDAPVIFELTAIFSMMLPFSRVMRNPTIKDEIRDKNLGEHYAFGFPLYSVMQVADILAFQADVVPVGEDQIPHLEMTREVARRFNQLYCGVDAHTADADQRQAGGLFPVPEALLSPVSRLVGLGGPGPSGALLKMSKSLNNAILLSDDADTIKAKVMKMYTDPNRVRATDPGTVEGNPLWIFHDTFNPDRDWIEANKEKYRAGSIGDVACKKALVDVLVDLVAPMAKRRAAFADDLPYVQKCLREGAARVNARLDRLIVQVKEAMRQVF